MKFTLPFLTLLSASSVLSFNLVKREDTIQSIISSFSEECQKEFENKEYLDCYHATVNLDNYKETCDKLKTSKCQKILENPFDIFPKCKNEPLFKELISDLSVDYNKKMVDYICTVDENGDICPGSKQTLSGNLLNDEVLNEICKSTLCTISTLDIIRFINENLSQIQDKDGLVGDAEVYSVILDKLESKECNAKTVVGSSTYSDSSKSSYKVGTSLLFTLMGILLLL